MAGLTINGRENDALKLEVSDHNNLLLTITKDYCPPVEIAIQPSAFKHIVSFIWNNWEGKL